MRRLIPMLMLALVITACSPAAQAVQTTARNRIVYGLTLQPSGFDPHIHASSELGIPLRQVYDTLVYRDPTTGDFVPGLASSWTISPDGLVYTFSLRSDVTFHDGTPFNAQAVAVNLNRITNPETGSQRARFMLGSYTGYEVIDPLTIRLLLSEPYSPLLDSLSQVYLGIASPTQLAAYTNDRYQFHQVGSGPFTFIDYVPGDRLVLRRNPAYAWGPSFYTPPTENSVDEIEFRFYTDPPTRAIALEAGDAQIMGELLPTDARLLAGNSDVRVTPVGIPGQPLQFLMNTALYPTDNVQVRQALLWATNRAAIIDAVYQRFSPIAWGPLAATTSFYNPEVVGSYAFDAGRAQALLTEAGFQDNDENGYVDFGGLDLEVRLLVPPWGLIPEVAQLLQDQWRSVGIRTQLETVPSRSALFEAVSRGEYNLVAWYEFGRDPSFLSRYFTTDGDLNWTNYSSTDLDSLLLEAGRQLDPNARGSLYAQAQRLIMDQALILPIRDYVNLNGQSTRIDGLTYDPYGWFPLLNNITLGGG